MSSKLDLMVVHVLSRPEKGWEGEKSRIDASVLSRGLTGVENNHQDAHRFPTRRGTRLRGADVLPIVQLRFFALDAQRSRLERTVSR